jgi:hypothetical protein
MRGAVLLITRLLIDADLMAYMAAAGNQRDYDWGDGVTSTVSDLEPAKERLRSQIDEWMAACKADCFTICLSDDFNNFRKGIDPTYKSNRGTTERPELLYVLKDWLAASFPFDRRHYLEADDVMGILSTEPHDEKRIIVSQDKDMITIPGWLYRPFDETPVLRLVSVEEAERFHLFQTVTGDAVDFYPGCPGAGPAAATRALDDREGVVSHVHTFTRGPRKGEQETRWGPMVYPTVWQAIVSLYQKAGLTERHAIVQARLARILRNEDFDGSRAILWNPPT